MISEETAVRFANTPCGKRDLPTNIDVVNYICALEQHVGHLEHRLKQLEDRASAAEVINRHIEDYHAHDV